MEKISLISVLYNHDINIVKNMIISIHNCMQYCSYFDYEIILVNNSPDINYDFNFNNVKLIDSNDNLGYCGGNNLGILNSNGDYIIIINPDVIITDSLAFDWLVGSTKYYNSISGKVVGLNNWYTYPSSFPTDKVYHDNLPFYYNEPTHDKDGNWKIMPYVDGSLMCFHRKIWDAVEGFDTNCFPGYFGENIFQFKCWLKLGTPLRECNLDKLYIHKSQHNDIMKNNIQSWTKESREYFYKNYAIPNWDKFLTYLR